MFLIVRRLLTSGGRHPSRLSDICLLSSSARNADRHFSLAPPVFIQLLSSPSLPHERFLETIKLDCPRNQRCDTTVITSVNGPVNTVSNANNCNNRESLHASPREVTLVHELEDELFWVGCKICIFIFPKCNKQGTTMSACLDFSLVIHAEVHHLTISTFCKQSNVVWLKILTKNYWTENQGVYTVLLLLFGSMSDGHSFFSTCLPWKWACCF